MSLKDILSEIHMNFGKSKNNEENFTEKFNGALSKYEKYFTGHKLRIENFLIKLIKGFDVKYGQICQYLSNF